MLFEALLLFLLSTSIPFCANRLKRHKKTSLLEQKSLKEISVVFDTKQSEPKNKSSSFKKTKNNSKDKLTLKQTSKKVNKNESKKIKMDGNNKHLKEITAQDGSIFTHNNGQKTGNNEESKYSKNLSTTQGTKDKVSRSLKKANNDKEQLITAKEYVKKSNNQIEVSRISKGIETAKNMTKFLSIKQKKSENELKKNTEVDIERDYKENVKKVGQSFRSEKFIKDTQNLTPVGQFKVHKGLEVFSCTSLSG